MLRLRFSRSDPVENAVLLASGTRGRGGGLEPNSTAAKKLDLLYLILYSDSSAPLSPTSTLPTSSRLGTRKRKDGRAILLSFDLALDLLTRTGQHYCTCGAERRKTKRQGRNCGCVERRKEGKDDNKILWASSFLFSPRIFKIIFSFRVDLPDI